MSWPTLCCLLLLPWLALLSHIPLWSIYNSQQDRARCLVCSGPFIPFDASWHYAWKPLPLNRHLYLLEEAGLFIFFILNWGWVVGYTGRGLTWQCKRFFSQRAPCWMQFWRKLTSFSDDCDYGLMCHDIVHWKKSFCNILDISWIFMIWKVQHRVILSMLSLKQVKGRNGNNMENRKEPCSFSLPCRGVLWKEHSTAPIAFPQPGTLAPAKPSQPPDHPHPKPHEQGGNLLICC